MAEDIRRIDKQALARPAAFSGHAEAEQHNQTNVVFLAERLAPRLPDLPVADLLPTAVDRDWRRRTAGLKTFGQRRSRPLRVFWPANDRGRRSSLPQDRVPVGPAAKAFLLSLVVTGVAMLAVHPESMAVAAALFQ
jgi:hypothetical protein